MLTRLHIEHYAIIDRLDIEFGAGMNVITGETGAGKSILMGALQLILGERADSAALSREKKCVVEGSFLAGNREDVSHFLHSNELDSGEEILLRREISAAGKSRSFINDTPVSLQQLKELALLLVDLHQQFDTQDLSKQDFQKAVLDGLGANTALLMQLRMVFDRLSGCRRQLNELTLKQETAQREQDYNRFMLDELEQLNLRENELEDLEAELKKQEGAEEIKKQTDQILQLLSGADQAVTRQLRSVQQRLTQISSYFPAVAKLLERTQSSLIELKDVADEVANLSDSVSADPQRARVISDRLSEGFRLLKKHGMRHTSELINLAGQLSGKLSGLEETAFEIAALEKEAEELRQEALKLSGKISMNRKKQIAPLEKKVNDLLKQVGMPHAALRVEMTVSELDRTGTDKVDFLFQANLSKKGEGSEFRPVGKVASGGELSRLMLCIKSLLAEGTKLPVLIFDEIDTGISGEAARQVGNIMHALSARHQLIAITHQPQIAARADRHFFVYKEMKGDNIITRLRLLDEEGRVDAIARMLGGEKPSGTARAAAKEMMAG